MHALFSKHLFLCYTDPWCSDETMELMRTESQQRASLIMPTMSAKPNLRQRGSIEMPMKNNDDEIEKEKDAIPSARESVWRPMNDDEEQTEETSAPRNSVVMPKQT